MRLLHLLLLTVLVSSSTYGQSLKWATTIPVSTTFSSARATDLNSDGTSDIVIGGGLDGFPELHGVNAINGVDGTLLGIFQPMKRFLEVLSFTILQAITLKMFSLVEDMQNFMQ